MEHTLMVVACRIVLIDLKTKLHRATCETVQRSPFGVAHSVSVLYTS